jgi:Gram-negative bacterial TonB protein C-terminal
VSAFRPKSKAKFLRFIINKKDLPAKYAEHAKKDKPNKHRIKVLSLPFNFSVFSVFREQNFFDILISSFLGRAICGLAFGLFTVSIIYAQRIAVVTPVKSLQSEINRAKLETFLSNNFTVLDNSLAETVFKNSNFENPFNLQTKDSQNFGNAVGCDFFVILKSENLRRASLVKSDYYESYIAVYLVSTRTGKLVFWTLKSFEDENSSDADKKLSASIENLADEISTKINSVYKAEFNEKPPVKLEELPEENSPEAQNFRSPLPFKRLRPAYTSTANLYGITATIDALVDLDENGKITQIEITRWAGYELDESVNKTIREMQWRPASRDGKTLPIRVLLRYNFKKVSDKN